MNKEKTKTITIVILLIALLGVAFYFGYFKGMQQELYAKGVQDGQLLVIQQIQTTASIPVVSTQNNATTLNWIPIQQICGGTQ